MAQKLIMPNKEAILLAGYKIAPYLASWGYPHYGIDLFSWWGEDRQEQGKVRASGTGQVVAAGWDDNVGNCVVVVYRDVWLRQSKTVRDLAARYYHLESIAVKEGDTVQAGDLLGMEGNTQTSGYHCHLELDTDTRYPAWSPQVSPGGQIISKGLDSTLNPSQVLYRTRNQIVKPCTAANKPGQSKWTADWNTADDLSIPFLEDEDLDSLRQENQELRAQRDQLLAKLDAIARLAAREG